MPWRLIVFIVLFVAFFLFITFNLDNRCDINFVFKVISDVPVFITAFFSFIAGMLCALPFMFSIKSRKKEKAAQDAGSPGKMAGKDTSEKPEDSGLADKNHYGID